MTLKRLALSLFIAILVLAGVTHWRASAREAAAEAAFPPSGQFVTVNGRRLHYEIAGNGPDLVLIHGASGSLRDLTFAFRDRLTDRYRVIAVDRPGLGYSDPLEDASLLAQARHIKAGLAQLGVTEPVVLGQSYGGAVALAWALDGGPRALVLVSAPSMPWPGKLDPWYRLTDTWPGRHLAIPLVAAFVPDSYVRAVTASVFAPDPVPEGYEKHLGAALTLRRETLLANTSQINALRDELVTMESRYPTLALPVELIHGTADTIVPLDIHSGPLSHLLPEATITVIPGAGHMPHHLHQSLVVAAIDRAALR
ncbi:alpha/beta hydrolase [Rhodobacter sp. M37P]|uniref:Alpha/beta hydrolase n=1 Tax=Rhodobacter calidifons TaxID=2715277 RepID=A0ABX0G852_9RHOB|nr:alpha/beta hydrolase [Rhodobacter calidifons]NHB77468.1 alpha/beta hydrolase [Rhodobacter calidifons]